ncbi:hypothetical protein [Nocardia inohanensis]|uniref:hypothetical protein n=1 Tax=Nocardia inohanensis TaxID=209246 RepID=UPI001FDFEB5E|nr:hypothetical protein [Nocardia inohanensis]
MLTPTAAEAVRDITSGEGVPDDCGLRISTEDKAQTFQLAVTTGPAEQDDVFTAEGARIFLDPESAAFFEDKILDTGLDATGNATFVVGPQGPAAP